MKSVKIIPPKGYEVDEDKSTFKEIVFKSVYPTYDILCKRLFFQESTHAITREQMRKLHAINQLIIIATYYNNIHLYDNNLYSIVYHAKSNRYSIRKLSSDVNNSTIVLFRSAKDAQAVIDNPNFRTILDKVYK